MKLLPAVVGHQRRLFLLGLAALLVSAFAASAAGIYLGNSSEIIALIPGLMVLVPPSINMRGSISGVMASRLSSAMHLGEFEVDFGRDSVLGANTRASFYATVLLSFVLGFFAWVISYIFGLKGLSIFDFILISVVSGVVSGIIVIVITLLITVISHKKEIDLDMIASPTVTTSGDIVTIPILILTAVLIMSVSEELRLILFVTVSLVSVAGFLLYIHNSGESSREILKEIVPLLIPLSFLGVLAGMTYAADLERLISYAVFLILIPPFMGGCGSIGGILCSRLATGMHMGEIIPSAIPHRDVIGHFAESYIFSLVLLPLLAVIAYSSALIIGLETPAFMILLITCLSAGLVVITFVNIVGYFAASMSFRYGLDPDNFGIPVITSFIDLAGAALLVTVINLLL
ncbi:MAG: magnesium transporter [Methanomicrobiaceae archaeon]|nr:magnesium transporter [Methanomicrobiaceae archaeon]